MRGPSAWSTGERELMAAMVANWNACGFCTEMHSDAAARHIGKTAVHAALSDYRTAPITDGLKTTLAFLEVMTERPKDLTEEHADAVLASGISIETLIDAIEIGVVFKLISKYASALDFTIPPAPSRSSRPTRTSKADAGRNLPVP